MPLMKDRQYRSLEFATPPQALKKNKFDSDYYVEGYATTFGRYVLFDDPEYRIYEEFMPECFRDCDMSDVIFQFDHAGKVYARQSNNTMTLEVDQKGLLTCADLSKTSASRSMYEDISSGLVKHMSWGFMPDYETIEYVESKHELTIRHHKIRKIYDVSAVSIPANNNTEIQARNFADGAIREIMKEFQKRKNHIKKIKLLMEV